MLNDVVASRSGGLTTTVSLCIAACVHVRASSIRACLFFSVLDWWGPHAGPPRHSVGTDRPLTSTSLLYETPCVEHLQPAPIDSSRLYKIAHSDRVTVRNPMPSVFVSLLNGTGALSPNNREKEHSGSSSQRPSRLLPSWPFWLWHRRPAASSGRLPQPSPPRHR